MTKPSTLTVRSLKDLGLYSAFDVSKWSAKNGIVSVYLEWQKERVMQVDWTYLEEPCWVVKDAATPGKVIKKFYQNGDQTMMQARQRAEAWVESTYEIPMKYLRSVRSSFSAPAVDIILQDYELMQRIWHPDPIIREAVPAETVKKFREEHPVPKSVRTSSVMEGV